MRLRSNLVILVPTILSLSSCVRLNEHGSRFRDAGADASPDAATDAPGPETAPDAIQDVGAPLDATADLVAPACTPPAVSCTPDNRSTRTCSDQGQWVVGAACPGETTCSGGECLCAEGFCDEGPIIETRTAGLVGELAAGGRFLFLAVNGPLATIRRFDIQAQPPTETVVRRGTADFTIFALDSDPEGNLISCSDVRAGTTPPSGQVMYGDQPLDAVPCTHVRRRDNFVYYSGDVLYRRALDASAPAETVSREPMDSFEIAGDSLYLIGALNVGAPNQEAFLERIPLADPTVVETILRGPSARFFAMMPDASRVYLINEGEILRVPSVANSKSESFWQEAEPIAWAMAQTDTHVYWTTTTITTSSSGLESCSEAQVFRQPKVGGGPATVLSRVANYCAGGLVVVGDHLYAVIWGGLASTAPTRILRIRL